MPKLFTIPDDALLLQGVRAESNPALGGRFARPTAITAAVLFTGAMLSVLPAARAGEKFHIIGPTNSVELPAPPSKSVLPTEGFLGGRLSPGESSKGPAVPPPGQSILIPTPKLEELIDRKKNWMFDSPNTLDRDRALEESFGIRKYEFTGVEKEPKGAVERYFEASKENSRRLNGSNNSSSMGQRDALDREIRDGTLTGSSPERFKETQDPGIIEGLNPAPLFGWGTRPDTLSQFGRTTPANPFFNPGLAPAPFGAVPPGEKRENNSAGNNFSTTERSWDFRRSSLGGMNDPINSPVDPTRSVINPISARKPAPPSLDSAERSPAASLSFGRTMPVSTSPSFLSGSASGPLSGAFNARPAPAGPAAGPSQRPKPMILEIPRPAF